MRRTSSRSRTASSSPRSGAVLVSVLALLAVMVARRSTFRFSRAAEYLALAPQAMPGIIVGIGLFWAFAYMPFGSGHSFKAHSGR